METVTEQPLPTPTARNAALYRTIWRWHFYAGLFVMPFIVVLSLSGALYLFKPQIDRWEERAFIGQTNSNAISPGAQVDAALRSAPGSQFDAYRLPRQDGDAPMVRVILADGKAKREIFVSPQGKVLGAINPKDRIIAIDRKIHGQLLLGPQGSWLVELAASWAIFMILSGLYLWWPSGRGPAGVLWPRLMRGKRTFWRDIHAVTGFWVSSSALVLLVSGLPWADVWGNAFTSVRTQLGELRGQPDWTIGGEHAGHKQHPGHDHAAMLRMQASGNPLAGLDQIVAQATQEQLPYPVYISAPAEQMIWQVKSETQNRPLRVTLNYDIATGRLLGREGFADQNKVDQIVGYGIAWHEGQLFGWVNVVVGVVTALALIMLSISSFLLWRRRKPENQWIGAPPPPANSVRGPLLVGALATLAPLLPLLALSLAALWAASKVSPYIKRAFQR